MNPTQNIHPFPPVYDAESRVLILGTFPSVKSREAQFYYGHPRNRFWRVLSDICSEPLPATTEEKRYLLHTHHIALWDTCRACEIENSADSSIQNVIPNDIRPILSEADIRAVFCGGKTAYRLYQKFLLPMTGRDAVCLPSTSPANAACSYNELFCAWSVLRPYLDA